MAHQNGPHAYLSQQYSPPFLTPNADSGFSSSATLSSRESTLSRSQSGHATENAKQTLSLPTETSSVYYHRTASLSSSCSYNNRPRSCSGPSPINSINPPLSAVSSLQNTSFLPIATYSPTVTQNAAIPLSSSTFYEPEELSSRYV